jgi:hypothetical protein
MDFEGVSLGIFKDFQVFFSGTPIGIISCKLFFLEFQQFQFESSFFGPVLLQEET